MSEKLPGSLDEWLASADLTDQAVDAYIAGLSPEERACMDRGLAVGKERLKRMLEVLRGDGRTWRCPGLTGKKCGGAMQLQDRAAKSGEEVWGCLLCGKRLPEGELVREAIAAAGEKVERSERTEVGI